MDKFNLIEALKNNARMNDKSKEVEFSEFDAMQEEYGLTISSLIKKNRRWQIADIAALIILIILMLYSVTTVIYTTKYLTKK